MNEHSDNPLYKTQLLLFCWDRLSDDRKQQLLDHALWLMNDRLIGGPAALDGLQLPERCKFAGYVAVQLDDNRAAIYQENAQTKQLVFDKYIACSDHSPDVWHISLNELIDLSSRQEAN